MKLKILSFFTLGLAAIAALIVLIQQKNTNETTLPVYPIDNNLISQSKCIKLKAEDGSTVVMETDDNYWYLPDYYQMPVDFSKLGRLVNNLLENGIQRVISSNPDTLKRLHLGRKELILSDGEKNILKVKFGKSGNNGGIFAQLNESNEAVLLKNNIALNTSLKTWADSTLLNEIKSIQSLKIKNETGNKEYTKTKEGDWLDQDGVIYENELTENVLNAIKNLRTETIEDLKTEPVANALAQTIEFQLKVEDDRIWTLQLSQPKPKSNESEKTETSSTDNTTEDYARILVDKAEKPWEKNLSNIAFKIPEYQAKRIRSTCQELLQAKPKNE